MDEPLATHRSKRQKIDKKGRLSALERLKQLKGSKNKYEVNEMDNVYDEVDEDQYGKMVLDKQYDDWIEDDGGGSGYVEDGREIFDDDLDDESVREAAKREQMKGPRKRKREQEKKQSSTISSMFSNMSSKKKTEELGKDDELLGDLMSELQKDSGSEKKKNTPRVNKFLSKPQVSTKVDDERLLASLMKEVAPKEVKKPTILDDVDDMFIYDKPSVTPDKPKIKSVQVVQIPKVVVKENKIPEPAKSEIETESLDFGDDFVADSFIDTSVTTPTTNGTLPSTNEEKKTNDDDLNQYIGDMSDIDFASSEMDTSVVSTQATTFCATQVRDKSQMWQEKDAEKSNENVFAQVWEQEFTQAVSTTPLKGGTAADEKMLPMPTKTNDKGDKVFRFFWWDAFEDPYKQPGVVYLFGKALVNDDYVSCCVCIKNIPRRIYLLPRESQKRNEEGEEGEEDSGLGDCFTEFSEYARKYSIDEFRSKTVTKRYAFERENTPAMCDYLEVRYPASNPPMDAGYSGKAIEAVFGTTVNALELFLIERNIKGPCWLDVKAPLPVENPFSWCKVQANCTKMENISLTTDPSNSSIPPVVMATINVQVSLDPKQQKNEIVNIGILLHHKFQLDKAPPKPPFDQHYCVVTHPRSTGWPIKARDRLAKITQTKVIRCETELELIEQFLEIMKRSDPDIIVGYDCGFQLDVLMSKIFTLKVKNWSCVGKLKRLAPPYFKGKMNLGQIFCGRPMCDIQTSAKELNLKVRSYDLTSLVVAVLHKKEYECKEIKPEDCPKFYITAEKLENLIQSTMVEASYILGIVMELNILPLALQITNIAGNTLSRTLSAGRAERNEFLLLHAFNNRDYITPDKRAMGKKKEGEQMKGGKKKPAYAGGLVLDPKKGFYDKLILLMDFNSLYPSIIQEFNLCFTTVPGAAYAEVDDLCLPEPNIEDGIVPTEIRKLVQSRVEVKKLMKTPNLSPELKVQYNIRQLALKLTANSMYGCLGATHCRFYAKGLAALVTMKGREILQNTKYLVEKSSYDVIYGDTDSIMINTNIVEYDQVFNIGKEIKKEVNKTYKKVELDIDGVFRYLLLLQKKKYAAVTMTKLPNGQLQYTKELKGLDIVRRDWCGLACDIGNQILDQLLSDQSTESRLNKIFEILQQVGNNLRESQIPLSQLVITKQLSKNPNEYPSDKKLSHVIVALRLNETGGRKWKAGDTVPYIICEDGTDKTPLERAYHIEEYKKDGNNLNVDVNYYLLNQIHPVVLRICEPIEGIDDVLLAQHLGVADLYKPKKVYSNQEENEVPLCVQDNRYENCHPLRFTCRNDNCRTENEIRTTISEFLGNPQPSLAMCTNPDCNFQPYKYAYAIQNRLQLDIRRFVTDYYYGEVECENPICSKVMRRVTLDTMSTFPKCYNCSDGNVHRIHKETELYNQLSFYLHLFTLTPAHYKSLKPAPSRELISVYDTLKEFVEKQIQCNAYSVVDLTKLFWPNVQESNIDALSTLDETIPTVEVEDLIEEEEEVEDNEQE